ncbi:MAG: hypothetical protein Q8N63_04450 [Nanoarchaeota archaeon]|nr:hypothetical protein [Nanoarchaeota archaeon]
MKNKKGGERILSIYLFIIYIIVSIGIVSGVIIFYGQPLDVGNLEAEILTDSVINCLVEQGGLKEGVLDDSYDLLKDCKFDFRDNTRKYEGDERYAVKVELYDFNTNELKKTLPIAGDADFLSYCSSEGDKIPRCNEKQVYVLYGQTKFLLKITSAVGKVQNA